MSSWITFWTAVLVISVAIFAGVVLMVTVGGAREILALRRHAAQRRAKPPP